MLNDFFCQTQTTHKALGLEPRCLQCLVMGYASLLIIVKN